MTSLQSTLLWEPCRKVLLLKDCKIPSTYLLPGNESSLPSLLLRGLLPEPSGTLDGAAGIPLFVSGEGERSKALLKVLSSELEILRGLNLGVARAFSSLGVTGGRGRDVGVSREAEAEAPEIRNK